MPSLYLSDGLAVAIAAKECRVYRHTEGWAAALQEWQLNEHPRWRWPWSRRLRVYVSGCLSRPFAFGPVAQLAGWQEAQQVAAALAADATGLDGNLCTEIEELPSQSATLAAAMPASVKQTIQDLCTARNLTLVSLRPRWGLAPKAAKALDQTAALLALIEPDGMTAIWGQAGKLRGGQFVNSTEFEIQKAAAKKLCKDLGFESNALQVVRLEPSQLHVSALTSVPVPVHG
jgi:hypothetical protein